MKKFLTLALGCAIAASAAFAASPFDGSWKLDAAKSHLAGTSFTYSKTASGMWHFSDGGNYAYDFAPDGKSYPEPTSGDTQIATMDGKNTIVYTFMHDGKAVSTMREELSADGKTLTDHTTGTRPDGTKIDDTMVSTRVGAGTGFVGKWKSTKVQNAPSSGISLALSPGDMIAWTIPSQKAVVSGKMDGSDLTISGPTMSDSLKMAIKKPSATKIEYWVKMNGKPVTVGTMTVSADGKWLTDTNWTPGKETEKATAVYMKQ